jgi:Protein of unknown function (DUF4446)
MLLSIINLVWSLGLTVFTFWIFDHYRRLTKGSDGDDLKKILEGILKGQELNKKEIGNLVTDIKSLKEGGLSHIQKVGLLRFNPFNETGGDNSFVLSLLDGRLNGIVITGLHARNTTRFYVKSILKGGSKYELSKEEKRSLELAAK